MLSEPIVGEQFFGRKDVISHIYKRVTALKDGYRQNIALTGQNLSGKSSILHHFLNIFNDDHVLSIYVEVTDEPFIFFSQRFMGSLLYNFLKIKNLEPEESLESMIDKAKSLIPRTVKAITDIQEMMRKNDLDNAYSALFDLTSIIKEETNKSCIIILDEFHNLGSLNVKHPFKNFGKKIMIQKDTMYIVTSSQVSTVKRILDEKLSLLFGNFEIVRVDGFDVKNAFMFLEQRLKYTRIPKEYKDFIVSFTCGNPFYLDIISQAIKEITREMTFKRVTQDVIIHALEKTIFNSKGCISQYLNNILETIRAKKSSEILISIMLAMANGSYKIKDISKAIKKRTSDTSKYLSELVEANILYRCGVFYKFIDSMFEFWLRCVYQKKRSAIISYLPDRINMFRKDVAGIIDNFASEETKEITERISGLAALFNNETVVLQDREYKLLFCSVEIKNFENGEPYILGKENDRHWLIQIKLDEVKDIDIIEFTERCRGSKLKLKRKILIALSGAETNASLMAKEEKIWIWDREAINQLMVLYGKNRIANIMHHGRRLRNAI